MNSKASLFTESWQKYLFILFLLLGAGLFSSGAVTWIAANWDQFGKFTKLYATQGLFFVTLIFSLFLYLREYRRQYSHNGKERFAFADGLFFFVAAVLIGALFALIGQIYQTGADPWQLFALWSLLQIPLLIALPNAGSAILLIVTGNTTLLLFYGESQVDYILQLALLTVLNLLFIAAAEFFSKILHDQQWHLTAKIANLAFALSLAFYFLTFFSNNNFANIPFTWLPMAGLVYLYYQYRRDSFNLILWGAYAVISLDVYLVSQLVDNGVLLFISFSNIAAIIFGGITLKKHYQQYHPNIDLPGLISFVLTLFGILASLALLVFIAINTDNFSEEMVLYFSIIILGVSLFRYKQDYKTQFGAIGIAVGLLILTFYYYVLLHGENTLLYLLSFSTVCLLIYHFVAASWIRTLSGTLFLTALLYYLIYPEPYYYNYSDEILNATIQYSGFILALATLCLFYYSETQPQRASAVYLKPLAWAAGLSWCYIQLLFYFNKNTLLDTIAAPASSDTLTLFDVINTLFGHAFHFDLISWLNLLLLCSPLLIFLLLSRKFGSSLKITLPVSIVLVLFGLAFINSYSITLLFALILLVYVNHYRLLFVCATVAIIAFLGNYYYWLMLPLLYKSFLLLITGLLFLLLSLYLSKQLNDKPTTEAETLNRTLTKNMPKRTPALVLLTALVVLGMANHTINKYEDVLATGHSVILKLAPLDPRSLMQGDYMELNYELIDQINNTLFNSGGDNNSINEDSSSENNSSFYALLKQDLNGIAQLCRITSEPPQDFSGCTPDIYIPVKQRNHWSISIRGEDYFFAEGKGEYFAQAQYGEYRIKQGKALLLRLLDNNLKPL